MRRVKAVLASVCSGDGGAERARTADSRLILCVMPRVSCSHIIGVGGMAVNTQNQVLCVREAMTQPEWDGACKVGNWKLPGGLMDLGEEIPEAVCREVFEETGVRIDAAAAAAVAAAAARCSWNASSLADRGTDRVTGCACPCPADAPLRRPGH